MSTHHPPGRLAQHSLAPAPKTVQAAEYWLAYLAGVLTTVAEGADVGDVCEYARRHLRAFVNSGHLSQELADDIVFRGKILEPGQRFVDGRILYSSRWL
jgi:hypothetical protein